MTTLGGGSELRQGDREKKDGRVLDFNSFQQMLFFSLGGAGGGLTRGVHRFFEALGRPGARREKEEKLLHVALSSKRNL